MTATSSAIASPNRFDNPTRSHDVCLMGFQKFLKQLFNGGTNRAGKRDAI